MSAAALELEQGGSPLASGLARITSSGPEDASEAAGVAGIQQAQWVEEWVVGGGAGPARGTGGVGAGVGAGAAGAPGAPGLANAGSIAAAATAVTAMELEESYARKNPELVEVGLGLGLGLGGAGRGRGHVGATNNGWACGQRRQGAAS